MRIAIIKGPPAPLRRIEPADGVRLLTAAQVAASRDAEAILETARRDAARIVAEARAGAARMTRDAREAAEHDGAREWTAAAIDLARAREEAVASVEREAVALAFEIARRIVGELVTSSAEAWAELVARSVERLRRDSTLVVRHAHADAGRVQVVRDRLSQFREVAFEPDESLDIGDCIAECAGVRVDARLEVQLAAIERLLVETTSSEVQP